MCFSVCYFLCFVLKEDDSDGNVKAEKRKSRKSLKAKKSILNVQDSVLKRRTAGNIEPVDLGQMAAKAAAQAEGMICTHAY